MKNQLIPPPELAPPSVKHLPFEKKVRLWAELLDFAEAFLISGIRARVGKDGDWQQAYREWCERQAADHEKKQVQFLTNLSRRERANGQ